MLSPPKICVQNPIQNRSSIEISEGHPTVPLLASLPVTTTIQDAKPQALIDASDWVLVLPSAAAA
jgi:hypothetical protein